MSDSRTVSQRKPEWLGRPGEPTFTWIRLRPKDAARALRHKGVRESRLGFPGWVEVELGSRTLLEEAIRWFGRAYQHPPPTAKKKPRRSRTHADRSGRRT